MERRRMAVDTPFGSDAPRRILAVLAVKNLLLGQLGRATSRPTSNCSSGSRTMPARPNSTSPSCCRHAVRRADHHTRLGHGACRPCAIMAAGQATGGQGVSEGQGGSAGELDMDASEHTDLKRVAEIARRLAETDDLDETLQRVVDLAMGHIDHCDGATMMVLQGGRITTPASTSTDARGADLAQYRAGEGPCLTAMREHRLVVIEDIQTDGRWPQWRTELTELGWSSMIGLRLFVAEQTMGALTRYSRTADAFDERAQTMADIFASHAAVAMKAAISEAGLHRALASRDVIGQAKGVLMERRRLSGEQAFAHLRQMSNHHNVKLREIARQIAESGEVPD